MTDKDTAANAIQSLKSDATVAEILYHIHQACSVDHQIEVGKSLSQAPTEAYQESIVSRILAFLIPIVLIAAFVLAIPFGYKLVLGGKNDSIYSGKIAEISVSGCPQTLAERHLGKHGEVIQDYLVITSGNKTTLISEENIAHLTLQK